jgi:predicted acylesterase/phospholipase RssA
MPANNLSGPRLFRTYNVGKYESFDCAIWEAARATSAAPTFFKRIFIGIPPMREPFVDGGMRCNNPINQILSEAEHIFPHQNIACVVSIGTGHVTTAGLPASNLFNNIIPLSVTEALKKITTDCEATAEETEKRFRFAPNVYFRSNVEQGMQSVKLAQWERLSEVTTHTLHHLRRGKVDGMVTAAVIAIRERREVLPAAHLGAYDLQCLAAD